MTRKYLVTGASSGIGQAICERLLADGHAVVGIARSLSRLPCAHDNFAGRVADLAALDSLPGVLGELLAAHDDFDGAVLSAGSGRFRGLEQFSAVDVRSQIDLNLTSHILVVRAVLPLLKRRGGGDVVLLGSESAIRGRRRGTLYCAAKFGLRGFAQALREECATAGIRVTLVNPGSVRTAFFDDLDFEPGEEDANALLPHEIADLVSHVVASRRGVVFDEISLTPLKRVLRFRSGKRVGPESP